MKAAHEFEQLLAYHCAPTLAGVKPASLLSCPTGNADAPPCLAAYNERLNPRSIYLRPLCECGERVLVLVYNRLRLGEVLNDPRICAFLKQRGYQNCADVESCLSEVARRMGESGDFPHEIGIFLGYPLRDVRGFIDNKGKGYKFCGCWKVYGNEDAAKKQFAEYSEYKKWFSAQVGAGVPLLALCGAN